MRGSPLQGVRYTRCDVPFWRGSPKYVSQTYARSEKATLQGFCRIAPTMRSNLLMNSITIDTIQQDAQTSHA